MIMPVNIIIMTLSKELAQTSMHLQNTYEEHRLKEKTFEDEKLKLEHDIDIRNKEIQR